MVKIFQIFECASYRKGINYYLHQRMAKGMVGDFKLHCRYIYGVLEGDFY